MTNLQLVKLLNKHERSQAWLARKLNISAMAVSKYCNGLCNIPLKRQVDVSEICNAVDFFIKNTSITGQVLAVDSGQNLNWQTPDIIGTKE